MMKKQIFLVLVTIMSFNCMALECKKDGVYGNFIKLKLAKTGIDSIYYLEHHTLHPRLSVLNSAFVGKKIKPLIKLTNFEKYQFFDQDGNLATLEIKKERNGPSPQGRCDTRYCPVSTDIVITTAKLSTDKEDEYFNCL